MTTDDHDMSTAGWQTHFIAIQNNDCVTYEDVWETDGTSRYLLQRNGVFIVGGSRGGNYASFATLWAADNTIDAWVVDADTGELRYFNGAAASATGHVDPRSFSIGMINGEVNWNLNRGVDSLPAAGQAEPGDLREKNASYDITVNKVYTGRWKTTYTQNVPADPVPASLDPNMLGSTFVDAFLDAVSENTAKREGYQRWWLLIIYARKVNTDGTIVGVTDIFPCCKWGDNINPKYTADGIYTEVIKAKALQHMHYPKDDIDNAGAGYTSSFSPP